MADSPQTYDFLVIGGGPAGTSGANVAGLFGNRVALIEKDAVIGGAGINTGTIPSKTLRETAIALTGWRTRKLFGVDLSLRREASVHDLLFHQLQVSSEERQHVEARLKHNRVETYFGAARFLDPHTIKVVDSASKETVLCGKYILIATGSSPLRPAEFPFEDDRVFDSNEILKLKELPKKLVVIGAGVIGSEYACTFAAIGAKVHLVDGRDTLLPFLDRDISSELTSAMTKSGIQFHWNERVTKCDASDPKDLVVTLSSGATIRCDSLLVCAGRKSNTEDLGADLAGITLGQRNLIPVDSTYRTVVPHIFATGDVIGSPALAATSAEQSRVAICHALGQALKEDIATLLPTGIFTIPEVSMVGETEESLTQKGVAFVVGRADYCDNPRGKIIGDQTGFLKLIFRAEDMRLMGVHVMGEQAAELVHVGLIAMLSDGSASLFNRACFNYPTLGDLYKYATYDALLRAPKFAELAAE